MSEKIFSFFDTYLDMYSYISKGANSKEAVIEHLTGLNGRSSSSANDHVRKAVDGNIPLLSFDGLKLSFDSDAFQKKVIELCDSLNLQATIEPKRRKKKEEEEYKAVMSPHSKAYQSLNAIANNAKAMEKELRDCIEEKNKEIENLKKLLSNQTDESVVKQMDSKVLVIGTAKMLPQEKFQRDFFLDYPERFLDVGSLVKKYGGEIDSPYVAVFSTEKELTTENYLKKIAKMIFKGRFLQSRLEEQERLPVVEQVEKNDDSWVERDSISLEEIEKNRLESINGILSMGDDIPNQVKLSLYAAWFDGVDPEMVELLYYAGEQDINADYLIRLLEKPKEYRNYRTIRGLLQQAKMASEAHIKREAALELITGEWYVEAEYKGEPCRFQMMPVNELQEFLKLLKEHESEEAISVLEEVLGEERKASFKDENPDGTIVVNCPQKKVTAKKPRKKKTKEIKTPTFLKEQEKASGVDCHPKIDDDVAFDGFTESELEVKDGEK